MNNINDNANNSQTGYLQTESLKSDFVRYLKYWKWVVISAIISVGFSYTFLRYAPRIYQTNAKLKILKKKESGVDLSGMVQGVETIFDMDNVVLENEMQILLSRRIIGQVVDDLNLTSLFFIQGSLSTRDLFGPQVPIKVNWLDTDQSSINTNVVFIFSVVDNNTFNIKILDEEFSENYEFGEEISIASRTFSIAKNPLYDKLKYGDNTKNLHFYYKTRRSTISSLLFKIGVEPFEKSEVLQLTIKGENKLRSEAILNRLIFMFNEDGIADDKKIASRTKDFVNNRLGLIESELDVVESNLVDFKKSSKLAKGVESAQLIFSSYSDAEMKKSALQNQLQISRFLRNEVSGNSEYTLIPADVGLENLNTNAFINQYNQLVLEREKALTSSTTNSPQVIDMSEQLNLLKKNIENSITNYISSIQISLTNMENREAQYTSDIRDLPEKEKIAREIERQQAVKENLYIFLLQKQVEAELSAAITAPTAKIVDYAYTDTEPISPRPILIYLGGLFFGIAFPVGILFIKYLFDTKITSKAQILDKINIPVIAEVPFNKVYSLKIIKSSDDSDVAESFRILKTNLSYLNVIREKKNKPIVIFSTSSTKGEGKTFIALNTASVFAANKKKVLVIGSDLRNPQLHNYLDASRKTIGLSSYLSNDDLKLQDILLKTSKVKTEFDVILSGEIPPNPSEILNNGRLEELLEEAKQTYDYIIVDTAPTMLVTDTLTILELADAIIYMVRANYTEVKTLSHINELVTQKKVSNMAIAINAVEKKKGYEYNYGYGYGYAADDKKKKWYKFS